MFRAISNYFLTLKKLSLRQIYTRILFTLKFRFYYPIKGKLFKPGRRKKIAWDLKRCLLIPNPSLSSKLIERYHPETKKDYLAKAEEIVRHEFNFSGWEKVYLGGKIDWKINPLKKRLWQYNLHYFDYGVLLGKAYIFTLDKRYGDCFFSLVKSWIKENPRGTGVGWERYVVARRIINWIIALQLFKDLEGFEAELYEILNSLYIQTDYLSRNLEYDIPYNHLICDLRALITSGFLFQDRKAERWRKKGLCLLFHEIRRQILQDGGHIERSTSYHMIVIQDLFETLLLLERNGVSVPEDVKLKIEQGLDYLFRIIKPDYSIPMLNDSFLDLQVSPCDLLSAGSIYFKRRDLPCRISDYALWLFGKDGEKENTCKVPNISSSFPESGYFVMRNNNSYLVFDCGEIGPKDIPGHAHCDTLSFELFAFGKTLIIDPGVYEYEKGKWRDYFRGTSSHNTITVDSSDQSVIWGAFRVARPARAKLLKWESNELYDYVEGEHNGYERLHSPVIHRRSIRFLKKDNVFIINDKLEGSDKHVLTLYFQLTPCQINQTGNDCVLDYGDGIILEIQTDYPKDTVLTIEEGWISYLFGEKFKAPKLKYLYQGKLPTEFKTILTLSKKALAQNPVDFK